MDRSNSVSSNASTGSRSGSSAPFAYQTRLLERTSSRHGSGAGPLTRSNSQSNFNLLTNTAGSSVGSVTPTRRTPVHRVGNSLDLVRAKWEERSRELLDDTPLSSPIKDTSKSQHASGERPLIPTNLTSATGITSPKYLNSNEKLQSSVRSTSPVKSDSTKIPSFHIPYSQTADSHTNHRPLSWTGSLRSKTDIAPPERQSCPTKSPTASSPIHPTPYRSSYLANKKSGSYGEALSTGSRRKLGNHLPRIVSGDRWVAGESTLKKDAELGPRLDKRQSLRDRDFNIDKERHDLTQPAVVDGVAELGPRLDKRKSLRDRDFNIDMERHDLTQPAVVDGVAGLPGRLHLKAPNALSNPTPSSRFLGGSWADTQRHLIQAYEYLCHVGEAQQWIEGCLGEELEFGVVELEDGLRNGVILAKLVRAFHGESAVRRIYEAPKLDFRHSDNINHFFNFVREVGLPEGFIFELTDLYEKKNLPKVIYCIHALSHLLARRGMAQRIGNLLGQLQFSDDQLQQAQDGLKEAGVAMPNFGNVGRELAKEINEEPEPEIETEDERIDRLLLLEKSSIVALQAWARGYLRRRSLAALKSRMHLVERHVYKLQAHGSGLLIRRRIAAQRQARRTLSPWAVALQARARGTLVRKRWAAHLCRLRNSSSYITKLLAQIRGVLQRRRFARLKGALRKIRYIAKLQAQIRGVLQRRRFARLKGALRKISYIAKLQAQIRGVLQRRRFARLKGALRKISFLTKGLQAAARGNIVRRTQQEILKSFLIPEVTWSIATFQAYAIGSLVRKARRKKLHSLKRRAAYIIALQAQCRGLIMRRKLRSQMSKLDNVAHIIIRIQAAARTYLVRKRLLVLIRGLRKATSVVIGFQARARANLIRQQHTSIHKALINVQTIKAVGSLQALARASIIRNKHRELDKRLEMSAPDVKGFQAACRGVILRRDFRAWRNHLHRSHPVATILQAMLYGVMQRRAFREKMDYYHANLSKVVKIQSLFRAKETREQYRQLTMGKNVTVGTIKNFVHLLDDSEADFQDEIKVERLRKRVVEHIRENQALENDVHDLDTKIALVVQNLKSFEDLIKARKRHGGENAALHAARVSLLAAHGDPFSGPNTVDQDARRKLELYQQLFCLLQTRGEYLTRLFIRLSRDDTPETSRNFTERVVLTLFGYGQDRREDFLLLKLFQLAIKEEIGNAISIEDIISGQPIYMNIADRYVHPRQVPYVREAFQAIIREVVDAEDLDLEADPTLIYQTRIDIEEMRSGKPSPLPKDVPFREAVSDPDTRAIYIRHLQILQWWTEVFVNAMIQSTKGMPYSMRYLTRETLSCLRAKFPEAPDELYGACIARLVFYRYINPALMSPEAFDIVPKTMNLSAGKKNLAQISKVLTQIMNASEFGDDKPSYVPINDFVRKAIQQITAWLIEVASVPDAESQFHAHEFLDATVQPKPIYISPNEIYTIHSLLLQHQNFLSASPDDPMKVILAELGGVPYLDNEELRDARETAITLELTNRFAFVDDPLAEEKTLWVQAKRGVLAILRVQPAQDLLESLMRPVTEDDELVWEEVLEAEIETEMRQIPRRQPLAAAGDSAYRLEDIRSLKFAAVKALAISNLLELEKQGKISREDGFQGILNAIAGDVRSKHRKRLQRQQEMESMNEALRQLAERKKYFEEQINSYHNYVETSMNTMQRGKGKKRFVMPFTMQYFHLRELQRSGQAPQFGSHIYSAKRLYDRGILLSIDQYSPRQFDKLQLTISSDSAGVFRLLLESTLLGITSRIASEDIRMEDLLQAKYEKRPSLSLFNGRVKVNFELFLFQINKKFYA